MSDKPLIPKGSLEESVEARVKGNELLIGTNRCYMKPWLGPTRWETFKWWCWRYLLPGFLRRRIKNPTGHYPRPKQMFETKTTIAHRVYESNILTPAPPQDFDPCPVKKCGATVGLRNGIQWCPIHGNLCRD